MHEPIRNTAASGLPAAGWPCLRGVCFRDGTGARTNERGHVVASRRRNCRRSRLSTAARDRPGRHVDGVPGRAGIAGPQGRGQGDAARSAGRRSQPPPLRERGAHHRPAGSSQHRRHLRSRPHRRVLPYYAMPYLAAATSACASPTGRPHPRPGARDRDAARVAGRTRLRAHARRRASRRQGRERAVRRSRPSAARRLRHRPAQGHQPARHHGRAWRSAAPPTCRRSRRAARKSTAAPTCTASACSPGKCSPAPAVRRRRCAVDGGDARAGSDPAPAAGTAALAALHRQGDGEVARQPLPQRAADAGSAGSHRTWRLLARRIDRHRRAVVAARAHDAERRWIGDRPGRCRADRRSACAKHDDGEGDGFFSVAADQDTASPAPPATTRRWNR